MPMFYGVPDAYPYRRQKAAKALDQEGSFMTSITLATSRPVFARWSLILAVAALPVWLLAYTFFGWQAAVIVPLYAIPGLILVSRSFYAEERGTLRGFALAMHLSSMFIWLLAGLEETYLLFA
jgi:hypothetical protein